MACAEDVENMLFISKRDDVPTVVLGKQVNAVIIPGRN